jgi:hypothetical protein
MGKESGAVGVGEGGGGEIVKPYAVEVSFTMIVMAADEADAYSIAISEDDDAWHDTYEKDHTVLGEVMSEADLKRYKWDGQCIPYGGDGDTRLSDILAEPQPDRDDKTIDMFGDANAN